MPPRIQPQTLIIVTISLLLPLAIPHVSPYIQQPMFSRIFGSPASKFATTIIGPPTVPTTAFALQTHQQVRTMASDAAAAAKRETITVANGCFWGTEHIYREHYPKGTLLDTKVGFIGGHESSKNPSYEEVCTGRTGHAEACQIVFDANKVSYAELVEFFYRTHDPTQLNRQGNDRGTQYRSALFPHSSEQLDIAKKVTEEVQAKHFTPSNRKIVTQIEQRPAGDFFVADEHHQMYLFKHPSGYQCANHRLWW